MMATSSKPVGRLKARLAELCTLTLHYARLFTLVVIDESEYRKKSQLAARLLDIFQAVANMERWAARQFHSSSLIVSWSDHLDPGKLDILPNGRVDREALQALLQEVWRAICATQASMMDICSSSREFVHWTPIVKSLVPACLSMPSGFAAFSRIDFLPQNKTIRTAIKRVTGPCASSLDPSFSREYSLQDYMAPVRADSLDLVVPYFWTLSTREAMVCDSCLLSSFEYDGLPLRFHQDMAQQAADEARHAVMYLDLAIELMPAYLASANADDRTAIIIREFLDGTGRLPVPKEGNLYPCMWHASLEERLVIMQIATEGEAVSSTRRAIDSSLAQTFPSVKRAFEVDYYDEVAHTRIGTRWLRHLRPDARLRKTAIEEAALLKGVLLLTCFLSDDDRSNVTTLMDRYGSDERAGPRTFFLDRSTPECQREQGRGGSQGFP